MRTIAIASFMFTTRCCSAPARRKPLPGAPITAGAAAAGPIAASTRSSNAWPRSRGLPGQSARGSASGRAAPEKRPKKKKKKRGGAIALRGACRASAVKP